MAERAAIEFETIVKIVIVLAVLMIVLIFLRSGFGKTSSGVGTIGSNVSSKVGETATNLGSTFTNVFDQWTPCEFSLTEATAATITPPAAAVCKSKIKAGGCDGTVDIKEPGGAETKCSCTLIRSKASPAICVATDLSIIKEHEYLKTCRFKITSTGPITNTNPCKVEIMKDDCKTTAAQTVSATISPTGCGCKVTWVTGTGACTLAGLNIAAT